MRPGASPGRKLIPGSVPLYSPLAVRVFGLVFGPLVGGFLAFQNLRSLGRPARAWQLLWGALLLFLFWLALGSLPGLRGTGTGLFLLTGLWLGDWHEQFAPEAGRSPRKGVWKPLLFTLLAFVGLLLIAGF